MRVSWGEDYAVIFMDMLAQSYNGKLVSLSQVSRENNISLSFLKQLAMLLKKKGLITSKEGITGGYKLGKKPQEITLLDIVSAVNLPKGLTKCCHGVHSASVKCPKENFCRSKKTWQRINQELYDKLASVTLAQL